MLSCSRNGRKGSWESKGKAEGKAETANKLLTMGVDIETISKATGMTDKEIRELKPLQ